MQEFTLYVQQSPVIAITSSVCDFVNRCFPEWSAPLRGRTREPTFEEVYSGLEFGDTGAVLTRGAPCVLSVLVIGPTSP
jgi:hypothetical protein